MITYLIIGYAAGFVVAGVLAFNVGANRGRAEGYTQGWRDHEAVSEHTPKRGRDGRFQPRGAA